MKRQTKIDRALLMIPVVMVLLVSVVGCGIVSDQTKQDAKKKIETKGKQAKQEVKKKVEAKKQQAKKKVEAKGSRSRKRPRRKWRPAKRTWRRR
jgi:hypothetical protein